MKTRLSSRKRVVVVDAELRVGLLGPAADASAVPLVEAAALLHAGKKAGVAQKLHAEVSGIAVRAALGSDAEDSDGDPDEASVAGTIPMRALLVRLLRLGRSCTLALMKQELCSWGACPLA